ncbi:hypothetical protein Q5752_004509 [Cryptotrichosporon argae]
MDEQAKPVDLESLATFQQDRVLMSSPTTGSTYVLGKLHGEQAIVHVQKTALDAETAGHLVKTGLEDVQVDLDNRPYFSAHARIRHTPTSPPDVILKLIWPATDTHIRKYSAQVREMIRETPELYEKVVVPYIESFPKERLEWVYNIMDGKKEADRVLFKDDHKEDGFLILPDLKWDGTTMSALYLTVLVNSPIRSKRDLKKSHIPLLKRIRAQVFRTAQKKYGVPPQSLRLFVHYQPSYYHFHVHVVHIQHEGLAGMTVGQAHMLDDIISLLELSSPEPAPTILSQMTFTYALGVEHGLYEALAAGQAENLQHTEEDGRMEKRSADAYDETPLGQKHART